MFGKRVGNSCSIVERVKKMTEENQFPFNIVRVDEDIQQGYVRFIVVEKDGVKYDVRLVWDTDNGFSWNWTLGMEWISVPDWALDIDLFDLDEQTEDLKPKREFPRTAKDEFVSNFVDVVMNDEDAYRDIMEKVKSTDTTHDLAVVLQDEFEDLISDVVKTVEDMYHELGASLIREMLLNQGIDVWTAIAKAVSAE